MKDAPVEATGSDSGVDAAGDANFLIERHVESLQGTVKSVREDAFTGMFDQLAKTIAVNKVCDDDGRRGR